MLVDTDMSALARPEDGGAVLGQGMREGAVVHVLRAAPPPTRSSAAMRRCQPPSARLRDRHAAPPLVTPIRGEYPEMPGLRLTLDQAQRRFGGKGMVCRMMCDALVKAKFLCVHSNGTCARLIDGPDLLRRQLARADLRAGKGTGMAS